MDMGKVKDFVLGKEETKESLEVKGDTYTDDSFGDELEPLRDIELLDEISSTNFMDVSDTKLDDTLKERGNTYGQFEDQARLSRKLKRVFNIHIRRFGQPTKFNDSMAEAVDMIMHKISRLANGDPTHIDSWHDIAGYAQLVVGELKARNKNNTNEDIKG